MAQTNYTPISLYYSTTVSAAPTAGNLVNGELAINITDGKLYYKDNTGTVKVIAGTGGTGVVAGSNTQIQFNNNGVFGASASLTWDGSFLTVASIKDSALTSGRVTYAGASGLLTDSANLTFNGTTLTAGGFTTTGTTSTGVLSVTGNTTLGDASADTVTVNGTITSNLIFTDNTYDIGASGSTRPRSLFLGTNLTVGSLTSTRVPYASTGGLLVDSSNMTFNGTTLSVAGLNSTGNTTLGTSTSNTVAVNALVNSNLLFVDGTYDIGASGATRPRDQYLSRDLTIGRNLGIGANATTTVGALVGGTYDVSNAFNAFYANNTIGTLVTNYLAGFQSYLSTAAGSYTTANIFNFVANDLNVKGAGHTVTTLYGYYAGDMVKGNTNIAFYSNMSSGANKWGFYSNGTANNLFAGNTRIGGGTAPAYPLDVTGTANVSGNLLVNTTAAPSYGSGYGVVQFGYGSVYADLGTTSFIGSNYFYSSGGADSRITTNAVGLFALRTPASGNTYFEWFGSSNGGTAGGTVSLTNYAVMNQNGLAVRSIGSVSDLASSTPFVLGNASSSTSCYALIRASTGSAFDSSIQFINGSTSAYIGQMQGSGGGAGNFNVYTGGAIRTTVDTVGRLGIGTVAPGTDIHISGTGSKQIRVETSSSTGYSLIQLYAGSMGLEMGIGAQSASTNTNQVYFYDSRKSVYIAAFDANSNFYVGNTAGGSNNAAMAGTQPGIQVYGGYAPVVHNGSAGTWLVYVPSGTGHLQWYDVVNSVECMQLTKSSGNLNIRGAYGYISDIKVKENIIDATPKLADLMRLRVRNFNMIGDSRKMLGLIAQEVEEVFPALIEETPDVEMGSEANGGKITELSTMTKSIKASVLVPMVIKALQELKAEFDEYKAAHP